jgi:dTMP kinase
MPRTALPVVISLLLSNADSIMMNRLHTPTKSRGAFVLLEGVDRCGKTTQSRLLVERLQKEGFAVQAARFPNRSTATGNLIDSYLQSSSHLDDRAVHLLFSANRWEASEDLVRQLSRGTTVVCDRYAYSGVAFSSAKVDETTGKPLLDMDWCQGPEKGLPAPDCVIFLDISPEEAERRDGYGEERYENKDMQIRVRQRFADLQAVDEKTGGVPWKVVNAEQSVEQVQADIWKIVQDTVEAAAGESIRKLWMPGNYYDIPDDSKENA